MSVQDAIDNICVYSAMHNDVLWDSIAVLVEDFKFTQEVAKNVVAEIGCDYNFWGPDALKLIPKFLESRLEDDN